MNELFKDSAFNQDISSWNTSSVNSMWRTFSGAGSFNQALGSWDVSGVTKFTEMFYNARNFNGDISSWNTQSALDMSQMFERAQNFNRPIGAWDVSSVTNMKSMFKQYDMYDGIAIGFNQPIDTWNVTKVTDMSAMFSDASAFNQDLNSWNVRGVTTFASMFAGASTFNGDVTAWDVRGASTTCSSSYCDYGTGMNSMFARASAFNRDLREWQVGAGVDTSYMFQSTRFVQSFTCPGNAHGPPSACYVKSFSSDYALEVAVRACFVEALDGSCQCASGCGEAGLPISLWNTSGLIYMQNLFYDREWFNQDLSAWDTTRVIRMDDMFRNAKLFNRNISAWSVDKVQDMSNMFNGAERFSYDISGWNTLVGANVEDMFKDATAYELRFECTSSAGDGPPSTCAERALPSSLAHRLDFSDASSVGVSSNGTVTSFADARGNGTLLQVIGTPTYVKNVIFDLNAINFTADGMYLQFSGAGGAQPEVFIVYRVLAYRPAGTVFTHATGMTGSYAFGTYGQGVVDKVGVASSAGAVMASTTASYDAWHLANVYFGANGDGFVNIDNGTSVDSFSTAGKYTANAMTNIQIGGAVFGSHDVPNLVGEMLIFDEKLSDDDRRKFSTILMKKWDILAPDRRFRWSTEHAKLTASDAANSDRFGTTVSISGDTIVVGAPYDDDDSQYSQYDRGSAYVFKLAAGAWTQTAKLTANDAANNDRFGTTVSISSDAIVIGAPYDDDDSQSDRGSAYVFQLV
jgi:surface protein